MSFGITIHIPGKNTIKEQINLPAVFLVILPN